MAARVSIGRVVTAAAVAAVAAMVPATAARATPTGCSAYAFEGVGYGSCSGGTGSLRVVIQCVAAWGDDIVRYGNLVPVGQVSTARCPSSAWSLQPEPWVATYG